MEQWCFQDGASWRPYDAKGQAAIASCLRSGRKSCLIGQYKLDLNHNTQTNTQTGFVRAIAMKCVGGVVGLGGCRLGPPQPVYPPKEYTAPLPRHGVYTNDPNERYDHFRAPRVDHILREADFDYGTELAQLAATGPPPAGFSPRTPPPPGALALDVDAEGRVRERERIMRLRESCYYQFCCCTSCSDELYKYIPERDDAQERAAAAAHGAFVDEARGTLVVTRHAYRAVVPKNYTTTDQYGHKFAGIGIGAHDVSERGFAVPLRYCRVAAVPAGSVARRPLLLDPKVSDCKVEGSVVVVSCVPTEAASLEVVVACIDVGPAGNAGAFAAAAARAAAAAPPVSAADRAAYDEWFVATLARSGQTKGPGQFRKVVGGLPTGPAAYRSASTDWFGGGATIRELGIRLDSSNVVFQTKRTNPVIFEHVNTGDRLHGIDGRQLPAGGKKAAKALGSPEFWGGSAASGIGAGLFTTQTPVYNPARVYSAPPVDAGVARTATLAAAAPPTIVSAGGLGAVGVADGDVILKAVVNGARVDAAAMDGAAFAAALASAAGSVVLESVLTLRDPVFGQDPCVQRSLPWCDTRSLTWAGFTAKATQVAPVSGVVAVGTVVAPPSTFKVEVPPGGSAGQTIQIQAPNGVTVQVQIPVGCAAGSTFEVAMPELA